MGFERFRRPLSYIEDTESVTASTAAQTLANRGVSFITVDTSGQSNDVILPDPPEVGIVKSIIVDNQTTSSELNINTASTANTFFASTNNTVTVGSTASNAHLEFISQSTSVWAVSGISSTVHWAFSASTGSTATA